MQKVPEYDEWPSLLESIKAGEQPAFEHLYKAHYKPLWNYASGILDDKHQAEDIVAESFIKLWERRSNFDNFKGLLSFLYVITRNSCLTILANEKRHKEIHKKIAYSSDKTEDLIHTELVRSELMQIILLERESSLPPKIRQVFNLVYLEGLSLPEAAIKLGVSVNTVHTQKADAMKKMRAAMQRRGLDNLTITLLGF